MNEPRATCRWIARSSIEPGTGHTVGFHTDIDSNQILFAHMPDTMRVGMPGRDRDGPNG